MMRGSTSLKIEQIVDEFHRLQGRLNDDRDAEKLATEILNRVEKERRNIHRQRIQRSAVRQVLRALTSDALRSPSLETWNSASNTRVQAEILDFQVADAAQIFNWAEAVLKLYYDFFVETESRDSSNTRKLKGMVSQGAAKNYSSAWNRFIDENYSEIFLLVQNSSSHGSDPLTVKHALQDAFPKQLAKPEKESYREFDEDRKMQKLTSFASAMPVSMSDMRAVSVKVDPHPISPVAIQENVTISLFEIKLNAKSLKIEQTWETRENAMNSLPKFFMMIEPMFLTNSRIDLVEISITVNGATETLTLREIDPAGLKAMLKTLLKD
jgi:hypothetical protein